MKLQELAAQAPAKQAAKVFESYFGKRIKLENLTGNQARGLLNRIRGLVKEHRARPEFHYSEPFISQVDHARASVVCSSCRS